MPCLNESETLEACIHKAQKYLRDHNVSGEIVVGDNGSTDGSQAIATRCGARVVEVAVRGYGAALHGATLGALGRYIIMADSDGSYDFAELQPFMDKLREGFDLVIGNRFRGGIKPGAMPWKNRYIGNPVLSAIGRLFFRCPAKDFHCGLRGYSRDAFDRMQLQTTGMEFASEMVIKATLLGMKVTEVPTTLSPDGRSRPPHLKPWRDGWRHLRFMLLFSPKWLFFVPGFALFFSGMLVGLWLLPERRQIGSVSFDIHTLLCSGVAMLVGFQAILFAVMSKAFAINEGLIPPDPRLSRLFKIVTLEVGLVAGLVLIVLGVAGILMTFLAWGKASFGELNPDRTLRMLVPALLAVTLGAQVMLFSFFLSVLGMRVRSRPEARL